MWLFCIFAVVICKVVNRQVLDFLAVDHLAQSNLGSASLLLECQELSVRHGMLSFFFLDAGAIVGGTVNFFYHDSELFIILLLIHFDSFNKEHQKSLIIPSINYV